MCPCQWGGTIIENYVFLIVGFGLMPRMMTCLSFGSYSVGMVSTLFSNVATFVSANKGFPPQISLNRSIRMGCPLAPYLYFLTVDALGYLLEEACIVGQIRGIMLPDGSKMVNNHFANDSLICEG